MKAARLERTPHRFAVGEVPQPIPGPGEVLLRVRACGVCRTDLHIVDGDLPPHRDPVVPGHQIVGEIAGGATPERPLGMRVGVSWIASTDGTCAFCRRGSENLCDTLRFTGYDVDGGYAEYAVARVDFTYPLHERLDDVHAAPLLCAGIIGFRALRVAGVERGERVGLYGFGSSAHLMVPVLRAWDCEVFVATRGENHRRFAAYRRATSSSPHSPRCARAASSRSTRSTSTASRSSTTTRCCGANANCARSRT